MKVGETNAELFGLLDICRPPYLSYIPDIGSGDIVCFAMFHHIFHFNADFFSQVKIETRDDKHLKAYTIPRLSHKFSFKSDRDTQS